MEILKVLAGASIFLFVVVPITIAIGGLLVHLLRKSRSVDEKSDRDTNERSNE